MKWENFEEKIHESWHHILKPFIESDECDAIYAYLKGRSLLNHKILPNSEDTWNCFKYTNYSNLKAIILGFDPYPQIVKGIPVADGLAFSCSRADKYPDSLKTFYQGINDDVYPKQEIEAKKDLKFLAEQGVLLGNISLTVENNKIGSHSGRGLWLPLWKHVIEHFNSYNNGLIYIFLGKDGQKAEKFVFPMNSYILKDHHPSYFARTGSSWKTNVFSQTNKIIKGNIGGENIIHWDNKFYQKHLQEKQHLIPTQEEIDSCPF